MHSPQCTLHSLLCSLPRGFSGPKPKPLRPTRPSARGQGGVSAASAPADPGLPGLDGERTPRARGATRRPAGDSDPMGDRELAPRPRPLEMPVNLGLHSGLCSGALSTVQRGISSNRKTSGLVRHREIAAVHTGVCSPPRVASATLRAKVRSALTPFIAVRALAPPVHPSRTGEGSREMPPVEIVGAQSSTTHHHHHMRELREFQGGASWPEPVVLGVVPCFERLEPHGPAMLWEAVSSARDGRSGPV
jgi:hypothetical protein